MNVYALVHGRILAALQALQADGALAQGLDFANVEVAPAARCRARRSGLQRRPRAGQGGEDEAARHRRQARPEARGRCRHRQDRGGRAGLSQPEPAAGLLARRGRGHPEGGCGLRARQARPGRAGQRRVRIDQPDRAHPCRTRARRRVRRRALQSPAVRRLRGDARILCQRRRRPGRRAGPLGLSALPRGVGRGHRRDPGRALSRRLPQARRPGAGRGARPIAAQLCRRSAGCRWCARRRWRRCSP